MKTLRSKQPSVSPFNRQTPVVAGNRRLREPQEQAYLALKQHFSQDNEPALVQIPVGCGKTGLMAILPFGISQGRTLLVAPNVTIREALWAAVDSASEACFWRRAGVASLGPEGPFTARIDGPKANLADCRDSHFVVTNVQQLAGRGNRWLSQLAPDFFDMVLMDEGHHNAAASWRRLFDKFPCAKFVSLTATPFRSDGQEVVGQLVYRYSFLRAMARGYIKALSAVHVAPRELSFTFKQSDKECTLEEVLRLKDEQWFSRGVALAPECNRHIVLASIDQCERLRSAYGTRHQVIAAACSVDHAEELERTYKRAGYVAGAIHSLQTKAKQQHVLKRLRSGELDVLVQVQMLGEGFDHPPLSVAAVFRPFRSLSPYIQFVGRVMRVLDQGRRREDNHGVVVSHVGMNVERHWQDFRELDENDQSLWSGLVSGGEQGQKSTSRPKTGQLGPEGASLFSPEMLVAREVVGEWFGSRFEIGANGPQQMPLPLLTPDVGPASAGPQERRREAKSLLSSAVDDAVNELLAAASLHAMGWNLGAWYPFARRHRNWSALRIWVFGELNKRLRRRRGASKEWSLPEVEVALEALPEVQAEIAAKLSNQLRRNSTWRR